MPPVRLWRIREIGMRDRNFQTMIENQWSQGKFVCVGPDSDYAQIPLCMHRDRVGFNRMIVEATHDLVCAYKPNIAFYEAQGSKGLAELRQTVADMNAIAPWVPVILDAKRGDIGNTNAGYVEMAFDYVGADAITVNPYLGMEALASFLARGEKGIFVLCRTSNSGAGEFQDLPVRFASPDGGVAELPLYQYVAHAIARKWNTNGNCGLVVGAMYPEELREVRKIVDFMPILIPGVGAQGGDIEASVMAGKDCHNRGIIINAARSIIFASRENDFAIAARRETEKLSRLVNQYR